jgi:hypothetical protein
MWRTLTYACILHIEEVLDMGPLLTDYLPLGHVDEDEDMIRNHMSSLFGSAGSTTLSMSNTAITIGKIESFLSITNRP